MTGEKLVGPATVIYLVSVTVAALWWASDLSARVAALEHTTVTAERIARLEVQVGGLSDSTKEMRVAVSDLVGELRRNIKER
jgi:hypothetical protein